MIRRICYSFFLLLLMFPCKLKAKDNAKLIVDLTQYVNPMIGTGGHGHVFVGASLPHGMVQLGPNNQNVGWDWCSGYHDSDSTIIGFSHTHLSGTGIADLGDILFMPVTDVKTPYVSTFTKVNEKARLGYYSVILDKYHIKAELTSTLRAGFQKYSYPGKSDRYVVIDLNKSVKSLMTRQGTLETSFLIVNDSTIIGYRKSNEWAMNHRVYFATIFSEPIISREIQKEGKGDIVVLNFGKGDKPLMLKTGISYVSEKGAMDNLSVELNHWDFEKVVNKAKDLWNKALSSIRFFSKDHDVMNIFYTSVYHSLIAPSLFDDIDGKYRGSDGKIYQSDGFTPYSTFSLWDTYRAVHPLFTLIDTNVSDYVNTLLAINDQQKSMPVWHLVGNETNCMVGVHSIPVVVDACLKGFKGINIKRAYKAVSSINNMDREGLDYVRTSGLIPADKISWSVAKGLEYAIDDYCVAQLANHLYKREDYAKFIKRSKAYENYFDSISGFMRGKLTDGNWRKPFNPSYSLHMEDDYVEGNAWQYTWLVPHDVDGLIKLFGGKEKFLVKLDSLFTVSSELNKGASIDITGMIGQYAHGNEPSHHILYLYTLAGQPQKAAELIRRVCKDFYKPTPDGLIGNEDCGQMSSWYIFSALGFYPVNPVDGRFVFGSPLLDEATIKLNNGKSFIIKAVNNSKDNIYIDSIELNGKPYVKKYITYQDIIKGGVLKYKMSSKNHFVSY